MPLSTQLPRCSKELCLRRLAISDLQDFQSYRLDPQVGHLQGWQPTSDQEASLFIESMAEKALFEAGQWCQIGIAKAGTNQLIGDIGLFLSHDGTEVEFGISLHRQEQGKGLASTAVSLLLPLVFEHTDVSRIMAQTDLRNRPAQAMLVHCGFSEIERVEAVFRDEPCIEIVYALSRNDFGPMSSEKESRRNHS